MCIIVYSVHILDWFPFKHVNDMWWLFIAEYYSDVIVFVTQVHMVTCNIFMMLWYPSYLPFLSSLNHIYEGGGSPLPEHVILTLVPTFISWSNVV